MSAKAEAIKFPQIPNRMLTEGIACPHCLAPAGQPCRNGDGTTVLRSAGTVRVHLGRAK